MLLPTTTSQREEICCQPSDVGNFWSLGDNHHLLGRGMNVLYNYYDFWFIVLY